ncbi:hypothetical protein FPV67DRAFT_1671425 [Lyophyllum atratum]|nr:hypothetical protein FPV67DRAFT_1671425 [Lyophyllum atratum]
MTTDKPEKEKKSPKKGPDGLTKHQRYYLKHPEVKEKNRERERRRREQKKHVSTVTDTPMDEAGSYTATVEPAIAPQDEWTPRLNSAELQDEIVDSLVDWQGQHEDEFEMFPELERLERFKTAILKWAKGWGGVTYWDIGLEMSFQVAVKEGREDEWRTNLGRHARTGRRLLGKLHHMSGTLPPEAWKVQELWYLKIELVEILVKGITTIDLKTSILGGPCTVKYLSDEESAVETATETGEEGGCNSEVNDDEDQDLETAEEGRSNTEVGEEDDEEEDVHEWWCDSRCRNGVCDCEGFEIDEQ